jgi:UDP-N-acetylmuramyl pentapeptide phosphotransferase/UDP-N-acetylglucosamine-1-phosphate transferase
MSAQDTEIAATFRRSRDARRRTHALRPRSADAKHGGEPPADAESLPVNGTLASGTIAAMWAMRGAAITGLSALICVGLIVMLHPVLQRYALAKPNARSSHRVPTPQGGGIAVIAATLIASGVGLVSFGAPLTASLATAFIAVIVMACVGAADDVRPLAVTPRLLLQALAVAAVIYALPDALRVLPILPLWLERALLFLAGLWFVNLVNFMDGIDWMTVAEFVPIAVGIALIGLLGALPTPSVVVALALCGGLIGFAPFNRPVARIFLGDVGSLPVGLVFGWLLVLLAGAGHLTAALLLPLYYLADATLTLLRRLSSGERVWQAHRTHYYQRATDRGFTVTEIVARVFAVNVVLAALALLTVLAGSRLIDAAAFAGGAALVAALLYSFTRKRR